MAVAVLYKIQIFINAKLRFNVSIAVHFVFPATASLASIIGEQRNVITEHHNGTS